jgi:type IV pilus assembly protein PilB
MQVSPMIRDMILSGESVANIRKQSIDEGMLTLRQSGLTKIRNGVTTIEEVIRESF